MKIYQDPVTKFDFAKMTRRDLWAFLLLLVTAPRLAVAAWKAYKSPKMVADGLMVGYKGKTALDAGFFYCSYIPLQTVKVAGPDVYTPKIAFKTRYGMSDTFNMDHYRSIKI
jgi:hypothetical protein